MPLLYATLVSLAYVIIRRHIIAAAMGLTVMDGLDSATFQTPKQCPCNVISISFVKTVPEDLKNWQKLAIQVWKPFLQR